MRPRILYASARYDEALSVLNGLRIGETVDRKSVEQYRSLCLLALGRASEAESAIAAVVTADPTYRPASRSSPRVRATFTDVRKRLLPEITTARYQAAKAAYDRKRLGGGRSSSSGPCSTLIDDPDTGGRLGDLRVLDRRVPRAQRPRRGAAAASGRAEADAPPHRRRAARVAAPRRPAGPVPGKIYTAEDDGSPSAGRRQAGYPAHAADDDGDGEAARSARGGDRRTGPCRRHDDAQSIHPTYDAQILAAARDWKYKPATFNGQPVRIRRLISIAVQRQLATVEVHRDRRCHLVWSAAV